METFRSGLGMTREYFKLDKKQYIAVSGIAFFGVVFLIVAANLMFGIYKISNCPLSPELQRANQNRFIFLLVISLIVFLMGVILTVIWRKRPHRMLTFTMILIGSIGIFYSFWSRFAAPRTTGWTLFAVVTLLLLLFIGYGVFVTPKEQRFTFTSEFKEWRESLAKQPQQVEMTELGQPTISSEPLSAVDLP